MDALEMLDPVVVAFTALGLCILALVVMMIILFRQTKLLRRYQLLMNGDTGKQLDTILLEQASDLAGAQERLGQLAERVERLAADAQLHVQRTGIVRFNAFPDTGSDLSFAIALLDAHDNGFVLSSLYGRHENRIYAKPIRNGSSTYTLTDEEKQALALAQSNQKSSS